MKTENLNVKMMPIDDLIPYDKNPRINENAVYSVAESINEFGFKVPIVVDKNHVIINGHTRLKAARSLGMEKVPVVIADDLTPEQAKAFRLADNMTAQLSGWDMDLLKDEMDDLADEFDMGRFGFPEMDFEESEDDLADELKDKDESDDLPTQYKVVISCKDKDEQQVVLSKMKTQGYDCQPVSFK